MRSSRARLAFDRGGGGGGEGGLSEKSKKRSAEIAASCNSGVILLPVAISLSALLSTGFRLGLIKLQHNVTQFSLHSPCKLYGFVISNVPYTYSNRSSAGTVYF